jgi:glycine betaine/proline transport system substrate-binding protein
MMIIMRNLVFAGTLALAATAAQAQAAPRACDIDRPVKIAGLDWDSNRFHVAVTAYILEHGYGCRSETLPGSTIPLLTGLARGDLDIMLEVWKEQLTAAWEKAEKTGKVRLLGVNFPDAVQGWFVPRYLVEGDDAPGKGLAHVDDLPRYKQLFRDPEEPSKGRFYNCKLGWDCETINTKKLAVYGLDDHFTNFRPGSGAALAAAIASAYKRHKPILYYYWSPSWIMAKYDGVMLGELPYDAEVWAAMKAEKAPTRATAYPLVTVYTGANTAFLAKAPAIGAFLKAYRTTNALVSRSLLYMQEHKGAGAKGAALHFLRNNEDVWTKWVPADVAAAVKTSLD